MKRTLTLIALLVAMATSFVIAADAGDPPKREQRGMWITAYLNDGPSGAITERNTPTMQNACRKMLDTLRVNHINAV